MEVPHLIGRVIFGGFFVFNGLNHFMNMGRLKGYAGARDVPKPGVSVAVSGVVLLAGGLSVLLGVWPDIGLWLLIAFLIVSSVWMHYFLEVPEAHRQAEMANFAKNIALAGAALMLLLTARGGWPYTLTG